MSTHAKIAAVAAAVALMAAIPGAAETRFASLTFENDVFTGKDSHYTAGAQLAFLLDVDHVPTWIRRLSADPFAVVAIGQRIYTPANTDVRQPEPHDRPYAGWLYAMGDLRTRAAPTIDHVSVTVGVIGPASGARRTQNSVHELLGDKPSQGWDTQVRNKPTFMVGHDKAWPALAQVSLGAQQADLTLQTGASLGTPLTYADVGAVLRYGRNLPNDVPVTHISLGPPRDGFRGAPTAGWYAWLGVDAHAVAYNSFIQGSTYSGGPTVSPEHYGADVQVGVAAAWPRMRVGFTLVERSREFSGQQGRDRYGQLALSFAY
jgi:lipid A 3-O-deacylase